MGNFSDYFPFKCLHSALYLLEHESQHAIPSLTKEKKKKKKVNHSQPQACIYTHTVQNPSELLRSTCLDIILPTVSKCSSKCKCLHKWGWISSPSHSPHTHIAYFWTYLVYPCPVQSPSTLSYLVSFLCSIGMATLAQPHSYSLPILVIGLTHQAPARSPTTVDMFGHFRGFSLSSPLSLLHTHTNTLCSCKWRHSVHEEEAGGNLKSSLLFLSGSSGRLALYASE